MKKFQLSAITASLMFAFSNAYASDNSHTCNNQNRCSYLAIYESSQYPEPPGVKSYWTFTSDINREADGKKIGSADDNFKFFIPVANYSNIPVTEENSPISSTIIRANRDVGNGKAHITIPSGSRFTQSSGHYGASIISISNMDGVLEKDVILTLNPTYEELNGKSIPVSSALYVSNYLTRYQQSPSINVTTSADIIVNAKEATGITVTNNATIFANNHKITLNSAESEAIDINNIGQAILNNVSIFGNNYIQTGVYIGDSNSYAQINNSSISLTNNILTSGINLYGGKVDVNDSKVEALYAITADAFGYQTRSIAGNHNVINITNSTFTGRDALLSVNPNTYGNPDVDQFMTHSTTLNAENSNLYGAIKTNTYSDDIQTPEWFKNNVSMTLKNSQWTINNDSEVDLFAVSKSNITFEPSSYAFKTLAITDLIGNANFTLNTDLANQQSDKIVVTGLDSGSFGLNINDSGNEPNAANGKVTLVETVTGTAQFALLGKDYVDAGAYRYRLNQEGNNWVLSNKAGESSKTTQPEKPVEQPKPVVPVEQPKPTTPSTSEQTTEAKPTLPVVPVMPPEQPKNPSNTEQTTEVSPTQPTVPVTPTEQPKPTTPEAVFPPMVEKALSEKSNALVSLRQAQLALVESNLEGLHQRLGELKNGEKGNVWVRNVNSRNKFDSTRTASDSHSSGFEQDIHSVQLGADAALTDNIRLGGFVGNARSDVDFDGEYSSGKVKTQSLGIYGTYLANNGFYWDNVAKYEYVKSESASTGKRKYNAYTLSTEVGRIHQLGQGWTVTPQIQAAWTRLSSQSDEERLSALTARAGVRVAKAIEFDGWKLQPYAEVNGITTQTNNNQVRVNQHRFEVSNVEEGKGRFQTALGFNAAVGNHRLALEGSITNGKYLDQPYKVQAVYRYSW